MSSIEVKKIKIKLDLSKESIDYLRDYDNLDKVKDIICFISKLFGETYNTEILKSEDNDYIEDFAILLVEGLDCFVDYLNGITDYLENRIDTEEIRNYIKEIKKDIKNRNDTLNSLVGEIKKLKTYIEELELKENEWKKKIQRIEELNKRKKELLKLKEEVEKGKLEELEKEVRKLNEKYAKEEEKYKELLKKIKDKKLVLEKHIKTNKMIEKNLELQFDFYKKVEDLLKEWDKNLAEKIKKVNNISD